MEILLEYFLLEPHILKLILPQSQTLNIRD